MAELELIAQIAKTQRKWDKESIFAVFLVFMLYVGIPLIVGVVCGFISKYIGKQKGYQHNFWWGFFLGVIGIIVTALQPYKEEPHSTNYEMQRRRINSTIKKDQSKDSDIDVKL